MSPCLKLIVIAFPSNAARVRQKAFMYKSTLCLTLVIAAFISSDL